MDSEESVLPQTQAELVPGNGSRLSLVYIGVSNYMVHGYFDRGSIFVRSGEQMDRPVGDADEHFAPRLKIGTGARAVNRLLWSLCLLLPLASSDWIGLLILSQAVFAAAKLIQPAVPEFNSAASPAPGVISMRQGED